jgi:hypothetical protein
MPGTGSLRPDFTVALQATSNCLCPECHLVKSGRRDLTTGIYASDASHPVQFAVGSVRVTAEPAGTTGRRSNRHGK